MTRQINNGSSEAPRNNYRGAIVARFLDPKALRSFNQEYEDHKLKHTRTLRTATPQDLKILDVYTSAAKRNEYISLKNLAARFGVTRQRIQTSLMVASLTKIAE